MGLSSSAVNWNPLSKKGQSQCKEMSSVNRLVTILSKSIFLHQCPFHGSIIARDEFGNPTNAEDIVKEAERKAQEEKDKPPEWQDPAFLKDLQVRETRWNRYRAV